MPQYQHIALTAVATVHIARVCSKLHNAFGVVIGFGPAVDNTKVTYMMSYDSTWYAMRSGES